jgi:hypothetical protein
MEPATPRAQARPDFMEPRDVRQARKEAQEALGWGGGRLRTTDYGLQTVLRAALDADVAFLDADVAALPLDAILHLVLQEEVEAAEEESGGTFWVRQVEQIQLQEKEKKEKERAKKRNVRCDICYNDMIWS